MEPPLTPTTLQSPPPADAIRIPRAAYAAVVGAATVAAFGLAWLAASGLGADGLTLRKVMEATAVGALATVIPIVFRIGHDHWALAVVGAGVGRMLLSLGYCYYIRETMPEVLSRPLFIGVGAGAALLLAVEVAASIRILSNIEHLRLSAGPTADPATRKPA